MSEMIQKIREAKNPTKEQERWHGILSIMLLIMAVGSFSWPTFIDNRLLMVWLSTVIFVLSLRIPDIRLHKELVQKIDALQQKIDQLEKNHPTTSENWN